MLGVTKRHVQVEGEGVHFDWRKIPSPEPDTSQGLSYLDWACLIWSGFVPSQVEGGLMAVLEERATKEACPYNISALSTQQI